MVPFLMTLSDPDPNQGHDIIQRQITRLWYKIILTTADVDQ